MTTWNTQKDYVLFWSEAVDGRLNFVFSNGAYLPIALERAAQCCADGGRIRVYERIQTYEVTNGKKYGI